MTTSTTGEVQPGPRAAAALEKLRAARAGAELCRHDSATSTRHRILARWAGFGGVRLHLACSRCADALARIERTSLWSPTCDGCASLTGTLTPVAAATRGWTGPQDDPDRTRTRTSIIARLCNTCTDADAADTQARR